MIDQSKIRNFCIIAHIDHGKSTLADRIIEMTGTLTEREMQSQVLDNMELERERGITIKSQAVRIVYKAKDGEEYIFNLIDTPGHVDFNYEVSRSLAACDGAILVVDAAQGIEAQTLANVYLALDHDLDVLPVINKIDLPSAEPDRVVNEIEDVIGLEAHDAPRISAKTGLNVEEVLEQIVTKIPAPHGDVDAPLKALIFDSIYDAYKGVIVFCRVMDGRVKRGTQIHMMATGFTTEVVEVGYFGAGQFIPCEELTAGMVGYITASIKNLGDTRVGDTVTDKERPCAEALPGYKKVNPMVYCGLYPADGAKYGDLRDALEKLQLNDASLFYEPETSVALGFGFIIARKSELQYCKGVSKSLSLDIYDQWDAMEKGHGKWRFTLPTHVVRAFKQAMDELAAEGGVEARHARYCRNHDVLVEGMRSLGFKTLLKDEVQSPVITSFLYPDKEFNFKEFYHQLKEKGFVIYPGKISQADTFRIGNIGDVFPEDFSRLIEAIKTVAK